MLEYVKFQKIDTLRPQGRTTNLPGVYDSILSDLVGWRSDLVCVAGYTKGRDWINKKFPGADHSEKSWRERVDIPLAFLLGN